MTHLRQEKETKPIDGAVVEEAGMDEKKEEEKADAMEVDQAPEAQVDEPIKEDD